MSKALLIALAVLAVLVIGVFAYFKYFVTPVDKDGMLYHNEEIPIDGGTTDATDVSAPKTIESTQIVSFDCRFSTMDADEQGALDSHIYQLQAKLENGAVKGSYEVQDAGEERLFRASHTFLDDVQELVAQYYLAQYNGRSITVAGLPDEYGARLAVRYASGESIHADDYENCFLPDNFLNDLLKLFERGAAVMPTTIGLSVSTDFQMIAVDGGQAILSRPIYRLENPDAMSELAQFLEEHNQELAQETEAAVSRFGRAATERLLRYEAEAFVTRADSAVVSFFERVTRYEDASQADDFVEIRAYNFDTNTGRLLGFRDVFNDLEYLPVLIRMEVEKAYPEQDFYEETSDYIRQSVETDDGNLCFALGCGCVHIFAEEYVLNDQPGGQHITLSEVMEPDQVRSLYTPIPNKFLMALDYDMEYWPADTSWGFSLAWRSEPDSEQGVWEMRFTGAAEKTYEETFYGYAPECWLLGNSGARWLYLRVPSGDMRLNSKIYALSGDGLRPIGSIDMALSAETELNPGKMTMLRLTEDEQLISGIYALGVDGFPAEGS